MVVVVGFIVVVVGFIVVVVGFIVVVVGSMVVVVGFMVVVVGFMVVVVGFVVVVVVVVLGGTTPLQYRRFNCNLSFAVNLIPPRTFEGSAFHSIVTVPHFFA